MNEESEILTKEQRIFAEYPVYKAVAAMVIPTIISQIITVIYNLAVRGAFVAAAVYSVLLLIFARPFFYALVVMQKASAMLSGIHTLQWLSVEFLPFCRQCLHI